MTDLRISVRNLSDNGGIFTTPFYFGFHDGNFDLFDAGEVASPGLESLAEDGSFATIAAEREAASPDSQGLVVAGAAGPIATHELTSNTIAVDGTVNTQVSFGAMILPSNDAFVGTDEAITLFDADGNFLGAQTIVFKGSDVYDAGTEYNTEMDAAFINQMAPNTGLTENGVVRQHPGFNGSEGNPDGSLGNPDGQPGDQIILGGANAFGEFIDPVAADFTRDGAMVAEVHINTFEITEGTDGRDFIRGDGDDDLVTAGAGNDVVLGRGGWDEIDGGDGRDFLSGGRGSDIINGSDGRDIVRGGRDGDILSGGDGGDFVQGGAGRDILGGDGGNDLLAGGRDADTFVFVGGDDHDWIVDYRDGEDQIALDVEGIDDFGDVLAAADSLGNSVTLDFGDDGSIFLARTSISSLDESDFIFA